MLATRLKGSVIAGGYEPGPIQFIGAKDQRYSGRTSDITFNLSSGLIGGLSSTPENGDFLVVFVAGSKATTTQMTADSRYTSVSQRMANGTNTDFELDTYIGTYGPSVQNYFISGGTKNSAWPCVVACLVFRKVDEDTPLDVSVQGGTFPNTVSPSSLGSITPVTAGAVIAGFWGSGVNTSTIYVNLFNELDNNWNEYSNDTYSMGVGYGYETWSSGTVSFPRTLNSNTNYSAASTVLALRPMFPS